LEINGFILASIFSPFSFSFLFYFFERKQVYNYKLTCKLGNEGKQGRMGVIAMGSVPMTHEYWRKSKEIIAIFFIINLWPTVRNIYIYIYIYAHATNRAVSMAHLLQNRDLIRKSILFSITPLGGHVHWEIKYIYTHTYMRKTVRT
jgi:hypothetical protein